MMYAKRIAEGKPLTFERVNVSRIYISYMFLSQSSVYCSSLRENRSSGFPTRSDTNRAVQPKKMSRDLKFRI